MASTIAAISSPPGPARRGVIRVSGDRAAALVRETLIGERPRFDPGSARAVVDGSFRDARGLQPVRLLWMRGPRSLTREDVAEFHLSGAEPLLACALARLIELGAEPAAPGEFTRRAFLNGRIDLSQVEGVLLLIEATNEEERAAASALLAGSLERRVAALREQLLELSALCEAGLDFDEADTGHVESAELRSRVDAARAALEEALGWEVRRHARSALPRVVLAGPPNAGKSSLFNALTGESALVSPLPGTTRDALEAVWELGGAACLLIDGPGQAAVSRPLERRAQELFERELAGADLVLDVVDSTGGPSAEDAPGPGPARLLVRSKIDLAGERAPSAGGRASVATSSRSGAGLAELRSKVTELLAARRVEKGGSAALFFVRHRDSLQRARRALDEGAALLAEGRSADLVAEALRAATRALDGIGGRTSPEDVLGRIFERFCIGK